MGFLWLFAVPIIQAESYDFRKIIDVSQGLRAVPLSISISNTGIVAFKANVNGKVGIYTGSGDGSSVNLLVEQTSQTGDMSHPDINKNGTVVYSAQGGVFVVSPGQTPRRILSAGGVATPFINDSETVSGIDHVGVFKIEGGQRVTFTDMTFIQSGVAAGGQINSSGDVAFLRFGALPASPSPGIYIGSGGTIRKLVDSNQPHFLGYAGNNLPINDSGSVAYFGGFDQQFLRTGVFKTDSAGNTSIVADSAGPYKDIYPWVAIDGQGKVAFTALLDSAVDYGIYTGPNPLVDKVVQTGDELFGGRVGNLLPFSIGGRGMNDRGEIAFVYYLATGEWGVAVAKPRGLGSGAAATPSILPNSVANGATYISGGLVPGSWAQLKGNNLAKLTRIWQDSDFAGLANALPKHLSGVEVKVNGIPAAVYFISPTQVTFQVPNVPMGMVSVQAVLDGVASAPVSAAAVAHSPGIFPVMINGRNFAAGVFLDGKITGDPVLGTAFRKAKPGDLIQLFTTGLESAPTGVVPDRTTVNGVTVKVGDITFPADATVLVSPGLFQINFTLPRQFAQLPEADYPVTVQVNGMSSPLNINATPNPDGPIVIPVQP